jgi:hypothetical protein
MSGCPGDTGRYNIPEGRVSQYERVCTCHAVLSNLSRTWTWNASDLFLQRMGTSKMNCIFATVTALSHHEINSRTPRFATWVHPRLHTASMRVRMKLSKSYDHGKRCVDGNYYLFELF